MHHQQIYQNTVLGEPWDLSRSLGLENEMASSQAHLGPLVAGPLGLPHMGPMGMGTRSMCFMQPKVSTPVM